MQSVLTITITATGAIAPARFVTAAGAQAAAGANAIGVARTGGAAGDAIPVDVLGVVEVEAGGPVAAGDAVEADAQGRAITQAPTSTNPRLGRALTAAAAAGERIRVMLIPN